MSRAFNIAVFSVLFLASAALAGGGPGDFFDASARDAFGPGQKEIVLALDGGRFTIRDGKLHDAFVADSARSFLTNAEAAELFALRLGTSVRDAGARLPAWALPAPAELVKPVIPKGDPGSIDFDGGGGRRTVPADTVGSGAARAAALSDPAVLQAQFLSRLVFKGTPEEKAALAEAVDGILKTKIGRELAREFIAERSAAELTMAPYESSTTTEKGGIRVLSGTQGSTSVDKDPPRVSLNRAYLSTDPDWRRVSMAGTLGHELFGHAFEQQRAERGGITEDALYHYRGDESGSRLIDWTIQTELAGRTVDGEPGEYLEDPEGYARSLLTVNGYYVQTLSPVEMRNPADTLKSRRVILADKAKQLRADIADMERWRPIMDHFVTVHKLSRASLTDAEREVREYLDWARGYQDELAGVSRALEARIAYWATPKGLREKAEIIAAADSPYVRAFEARLKKRALDLSRLRAAARDGRGPSSTPAITLPGLVIRASPTGEPPPEPITLTELRAMYGKDRKDNPKHWENKR